MVEAMHLPDVLQIMHSGDEFSLCVVSHDKKRKTGGDYIRIPKAILSGSRTSGDAAPSITPKNPNNKRNRTRNILNLNNQEILKIKIDLIDEFNGKKVVA